jgi:hypothetical protein
VDPVVNFLSMDDPFERSLKTQPDLVAIDSNYGDDDIMVDNDFFADPA